LVLQTRDRLILQKLTTLRLLDRDQIRTLAGFGSISRINVRLAKLRKAGLIVRYFIASSTGSKSAVYGLAKAGAAEIHALFVSMKWQPDSVLLGNSFAAHQLALNDVYVAASRECSLRWRTFPVPPVAAVPVVPDPAIDTETGTFFIEMDMGTESLSVWNRKISLYLKLALTGAYRDITERPHFAVLVVATTEERLQQLRRRISKQTQKLFWLATLSIIQQQGFWSASWLRPQGETPSPPGA
jgi:hypothetical protein